MKLLTTSEAAEYLRLKERKVYEMVAEGSVPCTKVTGRWLFPKIELDLWLANSVTRPAGMGPRDAPPQIVGGSHDLLLEWALQQSGCGLAMLSVGSEGGIERFVDGDVAAASIHLHEAGSVDSDANIAFMKSRADLHDAVLVSVCKREQGLVVPKGNPKRITSVRDAIASKARFAVRQPGAGAQLLLLALLHREGTALEKLNTLPAVCVTGNEVGQAVRAGHADVGISSRAVADSAGLDFNPIGWEDFDLLVRHRTYFSNSFQVLLEFMRSQAFASRARVLGGYDVTSSGHIRFAG